MAQSMIDQFKNLNQRIRLLRSTGNISLQKINKLETYLNRRKQQNQYPLTHTHTHNDNKVVTNVSWNKRLSIFSNGKRIL